MNNKYRVICLDENGEYVVATKQVFDSKLLAEKYAKTISYTRNPIVFIEWCDE